MYESRTTEIINPKDGNPTIRKARFLKPNARNINNMSEFPKTTLISDIFTHRNLQKWPLNVHFTGWKEPRKNWTKWFNSLVTNHATTWYHSGIIDGIQASCHKIPCNKDLILGVCEFWCPKTNSFIFPWGEATITLEDVMILGGLPVIGECLNKPIEENSVKIHGGLRRAIWEISEKSGGEREVTHSAWIKHFMEEEEEGEIEHEEGEFEHVAFLSLWLSRFVLPDQFESVIGSYVFSIAIHLSQGTPIALAPVVLAKLYNELTLLTNNVIDLPLDSKCNVVGLFKIVQLWVVERFPEFGASLAKPLGSGDPRVARWDNVEFEVTLEHVRERLKVGKGFRWRPYASDLENWDHLPFYQETEQLISNCAVLDDCKLSFARFLYPCRIDGLGNSCKEKYQPHRVAMQFGYDQDIPGEFRVSAAEWDKMGLYIPSRTFEPGVSRSYYNWWKDFIFRHEEAVRDFLKTKRGKGSSKRSVGGQESGKCRPGMEGKSSCASPQLMLDSCENKGDKDDNGSRDFDHLPLALRSCSNAMLKKVAPRNETIRGQTSAAIKSPRIKIKGSSDPNGGKGIPMAKKHVVFDSLDIDHVPLALRLQSIARSGGTLKRKRVASNSLDIDHVPLAMRLQPIAGSGGTLDQIESYASTGNEGKSLQEKKQTEKVASLRSDAASHITRKGTSPRNTPDVTDTEVEDNASGMSSELLARVAKLEKDVAALAAFKLRSSEFSNCD
ncbi:hypothetical protein BVRB_4g091290 [Beta vulgaris subsp. vulgaris]|nr:hypothetical protein BVRB_4g091290 [Beta vulgaris subsp. vulgaris]